MAKVCLLLALFLADAQSGLFAQRVLPLLPRSSSTSRQFIVFSPDARLRGALCEAGERTKAALLRVLAQPDGWKTPILVNAQGSQANLPQAPPAVLRVSQTGHGLKLQLDLVLGGEIDADALEKELLRAVMLERMYRDRPDTPVGTRFVEPPDWLLQGVLGAEEAQTSSAIYSSLNSVAERKRVLPLPDFLRQRPELLDNPSRRLYRAYSYALVSLITNLPGGREALPQYLSRLPDGSADVVENVKASFPVLFSAGGESNKIWDGHIMRLAATQLFRPFSAADTEAKLEPLLSLQFPGQPRIWALAEFEQFMRKPDRTGLLQHRHKELMLLAAQANPIYRALVLEYEQIVLRLAHGKVRGVAKRISAANRSRQKIAHRMREIEDYMNWFQATQSAVSSENFAGYLKAAENGEAAPRRRDAISIYLSALENQLR